jgi:ribosomal-protein-alanine N-acetyltransferase
MAGPAARVRPFRPDDLHTISEIDRECFAPGIAYSRRLIRDLLAVADVFCRVAEIAGTIAGFTIAHASAGEGHIITLDVGEQFRRRRVGTQLLAAVEDELSRRAARQVWLETATDNHPAIAFWQKHGYRIESVLKHYYGLGKDAFAMSKRLHRQSRATE